MNNTHFVARVVLLLFVLLTYFGIREISKDQKEAASVEEQPSQVTDKLLVKTPME